MNVNVHLLAEETISTEPDIASTKFAIEDNIGESIHLHYRNIRYEFTIDEFINFGELVKLASERINE